MGKETAMNMKLRLIVFVTTLLLPAGPARGEVITLTSSLPGLSFSLPATIGSFTYSLPAGSSIEFAGLFSPEFVFPPVSESFVLEFSFDGTPAISLPLSPEDTEFFLGADVTFLEPFLRDGSMRLGVLCGTGQCPLSYTAVAGEWSLLIRASPPGGTVVPEPSTIVLVLLGSAAALRRRARRAYASLGVSGPHDS
jgi:hypothetical protein